MPLNAFSRYSIIIINKMGEMSSDLHAPDTQTPTGEKATQDKWQENGRWGRGRGGGKGGILRSFSGKEEGNLFPC